MIERGITKKTHRNQSIGHSNEPGRAFRRFLRKSQWQNCLTGRLAVFGFVLHFFTNSQPAQALELSYGGRLTSPSGEPLTGPLDLTFRFYRDASGGSPLATVPVPSVSLTDGVFQTSLNLSAEDMDRLFEDGVKTVFVEVETKGKVYPRQKFSYVPLALRVPVDGSKITYDSEGRLTISPGALSQSTNLPGATGTGGVEKVGDQTFRTYELSAAGKDLVGAVDVTAQRSLLGLGNLDGVLDSKLSLSGGTMTGAINMGGSHKITNLADPSDSGDAAKKSYVDGKLGGQPLVVGTPSPGQVIKWDGSKFALATDAVGEPRGGIASLNTLTSDRQSLAVESPGVTTGTRPAWTADIGTSTHTLTIPLASANGVTAGLISKTDFDVFSSKQAAITPSSVLETGTMTTNLQNALEIKPYGTNAAQTGELRFRELEASGSQYVGLKAPDTLATNTIWTLPVGDGPSGYVLSTDGSGTLSWISPSSGSVTSIVPGTGLTGGPISAAGTISLADVGTAGTYIKVTTNAQGQVISGATLSDTDIPNLSATKITSGTLAVEQGGTGTDTAQPFSVLAGPSIGPTAGAPSFRALVAADIPSLDASKITSGTLANSLINWSAAPVTTVAGRTGTVTLANTDIAGLGSLATINAVSGGTAGTITDDSITNADINSGAAIADTKLATIATAGKVANSATTATSASTANAIVARDGSGNFTAGIITATLNGNATNVTGTVALANGGTGATTAAGARTNLGAAASGVNSDITSITGLTTAISVAQGGTGATSAAGARINLGAAASGANSDITSLTNLTSLSTTGNVGIGSSTPSSRLDVATSGAGIQTVERLQNTVTAANNSGTQIMYSANRTTNGLTDVAAVGGMITDISASAYKGALVFSTANNATPVERMRIDSNGNVGMGTTSPANILHVRQDTADTNTANGGSPWAGSVVNVENPNQTNGSKVGLLLTTRDSNSDSYTVSSVFSIVKNHTAGAVAADLIMGTTNVGSHFERMRITSDGNVGIGTTSPDRKLRVSNTSSESDEVLALYRAPASNTSAGRSPVSLAFIGAGHSQSGASYGWSLGGSNDVLGKIVVTPRSYIEVPNNMSMGVNSSMGFYVANSAGGGLVERMTLFANGNVGIGTTSPGAALEVAGNAQVNGELKLQGSVLRFRNDPGGGGGDQAWLYYYAETGENTRLEMRVQNDADDDIFIRATGGTTTGTGDLAELYLSHETLQLGDLVEFDPSTPGAVRKSRASNRTSLLGVISAKPFALLMALSKEKLDRTDHYPVTLAGKMMVKISLENGPIRPGDPLAAASIPGFAAKAVEPGKIIGYAFEEFDGSYLSTPGVEDMFNDVSDCKTCEYNLRQFPFVPQAAPFTHQKGIMLALVQPTFFNRIDNSDTRIQEVTEEIKKKSIEIDRLKTELNAIKQILCDGKVSSSICP